MTTQQFYHPFRPAIAMIELIFAIVIMGIVFMSAPMMISSATKSSTVAFQQESIAIAAAHTASLMSYAWDEQNSDGRVKQNNNVLCTNSSTGALDRNVSITPNRLRGEDTNCSNASTAFGQPDLDPDDATIHELVPDDIDDFDGNITTLTVADQSPSVANEGDYMDQNITITTQVFYESDAPSDPTFGTCTSSSGCAYSNPGLVAGSTTNVKGITTTLTSANLPDKQIVLNAFMCNIGAPNVVAQGGY